jgi:hypothetical protein
VDQRRDTRRGVVRERLRRRCAHRRHLLLGRGPASDPRPVERDVRLHLGSRMERGRAAREVYYVGDLDPAGLETEASLHEELTRHADVEVGASRRHVGAGGDVGPAGLSAVVAPTSPPVAANSLSWTKATSTSYSRAHRLRAGPANLLQPDRELATTQRGRVTSEAMPQARTIDGPKSSDRRPQQAPAVEPEVERQSLYRCPTQARGTTRAPTPRTRTCPLPPRDEAMKRSTARALPTATVATDKRALLPPQTKQT